MGEKGTFSPLFPSFALVLTIALVLVCTDLHVSGLHIPALSSRSQHFFEPLLNKAVLRRVLHDGAMPLGHVQDAL